MDEMMPRPYPAGMMSVGHLRDKPVTFERRLEIQALAARLAGEIAKKTEANERRIVFSMISDLLPE